MGQPIHEVPMGAPADAEEELQAKMARLQVAREKAEKEAQRERDVSRLIELGAETRERAIELLERYGSLQAAANALCAAADASIPSDVRRWVEQLRSGGGGQKEQAAAALKIQAVHRGKQTRMELRKERERDAVLKPASSNRKNKVAPMPPGRDGKEDASDASDALYFSEDENGHARAEDVAVRAASSLVGANAQLAGALEAAAAVSNRPSAARVGGADARGSARGAPGLSKHMVNDLAKRLPSLCGGGRGGEMEALKLIAAVVATRRRRSNVRSNKVAPLDAAR